MFYHLFNLFEKLGWDFPGMNLMHYLSVRAILASIFAVSFALIFGKWFVRRLRSRKELLEGEREEDAQTAGQNEKKNTPGFGGVIIIFGILFGVLLFADLTNIYILLLCFSLLWCGALGFADDYIKSVKKNKKGLPGKVKLFCQIILGFVEPEAAIAEMNQKLYSAGLERYMAAKQAALNEWAASKGIQ